MAAYNYDWRHNIIIIRPYTAVATGGEHKITTVAHLTVFNAKPIHSIFGIYFLDGLVHRVLSSSSKQLESDCGVWGNPRSYNWCNLELSHWLEGSTPPTHGQFRLSLESLESDAISCPENSHPRTGRPPCMNQGEILPSYSKWRCKRPSLRVSRGLMLYVVRVWQKQMIKTRAVKLSQRHMS